MRQHHAQPYQRRHHVKKLDRLFYNAIGYLSYFSLLLLTALASASLTAMKLLTIING